MPEADEIVARVLTWVANQCANRIRISVHNLRLTRRRTRAKIQKMDPAAITATAAGTAAAFTGIGAWGGFVRHRAHVRRWTKSSGNAGAARSSGPTRSASHIFHDRQARSRVSENRSRCGRTWARRCESYRDASEPGFSLRAQSWRGAGEMPRSDIVSDGPRSAMDASAIWRARAESRSNGGREWNRRSGDVVEMGARLEGAAGRGGD